MRNLLQPALAFAVVVLPIHAATIYTTTLSGANETPPNSSPGTGTATLTLNDDMLNVAITFSGLVATDIAAHIHCCSLPGVAAGIALPFTGFPTGVTSGSYNHTFDLTSLATYMSGFDGGTAASDEAALIAGLNAGMAYVNIHSTTFTGGEIRGQVAAQVSAVPEPSTFILGATMLAGIIVLKRKKT